MASANVVEVVDALFETNSHTRLGQEQDRPNVLIDAAPVRGSIWRRAYTYYILFTGLGCFIFGFDTGSIGPITVMPRFKAKFDPISPTLQGLIVSSILLPASISSFIAGPIADRISRKYTFSLGSAIFCAGAILECISVDLPMLFVGRCISGIGEGLFFSTATTYVVEIAPAANRGRLLAMQTTFVTIGVAAGFFVAYGTVNIPSSLSWRFPFGMQATVSAIFSIGSYFIPHSPRWLRHVGRNADAVTAWAALGYTPAEAEKEEESAQRGEQHEQRPNRSLGQTAKDLWAKDVRVQTFLGCFLMAMQQACGIDGILYYAPVLFSKAGLSSTQASFLASGVSGLLNVGGTIVAQFFTDKWGRRPTTIIGGAILAVAMFTIGTLYATDATSHAAGRNCVIALIYIFGVVFCMTWAIVIRMVSSELQPVKTRAAATSLAQCANWSVNWLIAFTTPLFLARSSYGPYFLFGACALAGALVSAALQPESKGVSLSELDGLFEVSPWRRLLAKRARAGVPTLSRVAFELTPVA